MFRRIAAATALLIWGRASAFSPLSLHSHKHDTFRIALPAFFHSGEYSDNDDSSQYNEALAHNQRRTDPHIFLTQRAIQSFVSLLISTRDPHTVKWLEENYDCAGLENYHGTGAFNITLWPFWDAMLIDMLQRPEDVVVVSARRRGRGHGGWSKDNPYLEERWVEFEIDINPPSIVTRILSVREQIGKEWITDLDTMVTFNEQILTNYNEKSATARSEECLNFDNNTLPDDCSPIDSHDESSTRDNAQLESALESVAPIESNAAPDAVIQSVASTKSAASIKSSAAAGKSTPASAKSAAPIESTGDSANSASVSERAGPANYLNSLGGGAGAIKKSSYAPFAGEKPKASKSFTGAKQNTERAADYVSALNTAAPIKLSAAAAGNAGPASSAAPTKKISSIGKAFDRTSMILMDSMIEFSAQNSSPNRKGNFDLLCLLATQESIHRVLRQYREAGAERDVSFEWLRNFYVERVAKYFDGSQEFGRHDDFIEELLLTPPTMKTVYDKVELIDPLRITEDIIRMRSHVGLQWKEQMKDVPAAHMEVRRLLLQRHMGNSVNPSPFAKAVPVFGAEGFE